MCRVAPLFSGETFTYSHKEYLQTIKGDYEIKFSDNHEKTRKDNQLLLILLKKQGNNLTK